MFKFALNGIFFLLMLVVTFQFGAIVATYGVANMNDGDAIEYLNKFRD